VNDERGAATVLAMALAAGLLLVGLGCTWTGAVVAAHRRAQSAADLAALAGAQALQAGEDPCATASRVAEANRAQTVTCAVAGEVVTVTVRVSAPALAGRTPTVVAEARAGPGPVQAAAVTPVRPSPARAGPRPGPASRSGGSAPCAPCDDGSRAWSRT